jgi:hypothetical protein
VDVGGVDAGLIEGADDLVQPRRLARRGADQRRFAGVLDFFQRELDSGDFPQIESFLGSDVEAGVDRISGFLFGEGRFERGGLNRLLDGFEAGLDGGEGRNSSR